MFVFTFKPSLIGTTDLRRKATWTYHNDNIKVRSLHCKLSLCFDIFYSPECICRQLEEQEVRRNLEKKREKRKHNQWSLSLTATCWCNTESQRPNSSSSKLTQDLYFLVSTLRYIYSPEHVYVMLNYTCDLPTSEKNIYLIKHTSNKKPFTFSSCFWSFFNHMVFSCR